MKRKVIQVGGSVRSGTTMSSLVLANQNDAIALGEVMHLFYPVKERYLEEVKRLRFDDKWNRIISDKPENLYKNVFREFPHINIIIDSSKDPFWFKKVVDTSGQFDTLRFVTYKHPTDLKESFEKRNMTNWKKVYTNYYKRFYTIFPDTQSIMLDSLLNDPNYISSLCSKFDLEYFERKLEYWNRNHPNFFGSQTVKKNKLENKLIQNKEEIHDPKIKFVYTFLKGKDVNNKKLDRKNFSYNLLMINLYWIKDFIYKKQILAKLKTST